MDRGRNSWADRDTGQGLRNYSTDRGRSPLIVQLEKGDGTRDSDDIRYGNLMPAVQGILLLALVVSALASKTNLRSESLLELKTLDDDSDETPNYSDYELDLSSPQVHYHLTPPNSRAYSQRLLYISMYSLPSHP